MKQIIYIHGFNSTHKIFSYLQTQLPEHTATFIDYDSTLSVEDAFDYVLEHIPTDTEFSVIGHSLGGILAHLVASRTTDNVKVENLVTISTPFGGSMAASRLKWFYPSYAILRDLSPYSQQLTDIRASETKCPFLSIVSTAGSLPLSSDENDGIVTVKSQLNIIPTDRIFVDANHFEVMQDDITVKAVENFIFGTNK